MPLQTAIIERHTRQVTTIDDAVEKVLKAEPQLTRLEAIKLISNKSDKNRTKKLYDAKKKRAQRRKIKGKPAKGSVRTVSGGAVSPR